MNTTKLQLTIITILIDETSTLQRTANLILVHDFSSDQCELGAKWIFRGSPRLLSKGVYFAKREMNSSSHFLPQFLSIHINLSMAMREAHLGHAVKAFSEYLLSLNTAFNVCTVGYLTNFWKPFKFIYCTLSKNQSCKV